MQSSLTDTAEWRAYCSLAAENPSLLNDEAEILTRTLGCSFTASQRRYRLVADRLEELFGVSLMSRAFVVEVGGGWGGQALELADRFPAIGYEFIDLPEAKTLQQATLLRYQLEVGEPDDFRRPVSTGWSPARPTLALSNYALSECETFAQVSYLALLSKCVLAWGLTG